jgi:predicted PurR-regulated permease PerM
MNMTEHKDLLQRYPLVRYTFILLFGFLFIGALYYARVLLIPLSLAALLAMLMLPLCKRLERWRFPRGLAIILCILLILLTFLALIFLFSWQIADFARDIPTLQVQLNKKLDAVQTFVERQTNISPERQVQYVRQQFATFLESAGRYMTGILSATTGTLATISILAIYIFFFMFYREKIQRFFMMITPENEHSKVTHVITQISLVTQQYLSGVLIVIVILSVLNSVGLLIIGIRQAIFLGCLAGLLNIIPYIGVLIGSLLPIAIALLTKEGIGPAIAVAGVFAFNQFLENNFLTPNIVGGKVKINPLASIIALLIGGYLWGVAGMILFIPFLGIAKIIFDNIEGLRPYGYLIGDDSDTDEPNTADKIKKWVKKKKADQQPFS